MDEITCWLREQGKRRSFKILFAAAAAAGICLGAEFCLFGYNMLKVIRYLVLVEALFLLAWIDWHDRRIPNRILLVLLGMRALLLVLEWVAFPEAGSPVLFSVMGGMLLGGGMFLLARQISRGGVGMGDVKLFAVAGAYMGSRCILAVIFMTVMASALYSIIMLAFRKIKLKEEVPYAPFVLVGTILTMAAGI